MFCFAYKCMYMIFNKLAVFHEDICPIVRHRVLHHQFVSTFTEIQHPGKIRNWIWIS